MEQIAIKEFVALADQFPVLDVRSPGEYGHAHIPGAHNLPLFSDEERKIIGTVYKQVGREQAIKTGLDYFGIKMRKMVEEVEQIITKFKAENSKSKFQIPDSYNNGISIPILIHCWRGGMRSAGVAWLLDLYGFKVYTLAGGYKSFRNWVLERFEQQYLFKILGGYTGSAKTELLKQLGEEKQLVIDLEGIAHHKGSAFGGLGQAAQPTQEMFENELGLKLHEAYVNAANNEYIWLEDESSRIGAVNLPPALWRTMQRSPVYFLDIPFEERLHFIVEEYGKFEKKELAASVMRIQKRLGGQNTKDAICQIMEGNIKESFGILLRYYDKYYANGLQERRGLMSVIACEDVDVQTNIGKLKGEKKMV